MDRTEFEVNGLIVGRDGSGMKINSNGTEITLISHGDGTEVIHHKLKSGQSWGLYAAEDWASFESVTILAGKLRMLESPQEMFFGAGDTLYATPVTRETVFVAVEETTFIYVSSSPVFHLYTNHANQLKQLATDTETKDGYTTGHCKRINDMSRLIGQAMRLSQAELMYLNAGAFLHDIGKSRIPPHILNKPGKLTDEEWALIKTHTMYGKEILEDSGIPLLVRAAPLVQYHHERYDGTGYFGLQGEEIPLGARVIAVADSFDAMTRDRPYQKARSTEQAADEIVRCSGTWYDPEIVKVFLRLWKIVY